MKIAIATLDKQNEILTAIKQGSSNTNVNLSSLFTDDKLIDALVTDNVLFNQALAMGTLNNLNATQFAKIASKFTADIITKGVNLDKLKSCEPFWEYVANKSEYVDLILNYVSARDKVVNNPVALFYLYGNSTALNKIKINDDFITKALKDETTAMMTIMAMFDVIKNNSKYVDYLMTTNYNFNDLAKETKYYDGLFKLILLEKALITQSTDLVYNNINSAVPKLKNFFSINSGTFEQFILSANAKSILTNNPQLAGKILSDWKLFYRVLGMDKIEILEGNVNEWVNYINGKTMKQLVELTFVMRPNGIRSFNKILNSDQRIIDALFEATKRSFTSSKSYSGFLNNSNKMSNSVYLIRSKESSFEFRINSNDCGDLSIAFSIKSPVSSNGNFPNDKPTNIIICPTFFNGIAYSPTTTSYTTSSFYCGISYRDLK